MWIKDESIFRTSLYRLLDPQPDGDVSSCKIKEYSGIGLGITFNGVFIPLPGGEDPTGVELVQRNGLWFWSRGKSTMVSKITEGLHLGDARVLSEMVENESCSMVFADPVYENIEDYLWLAKTAERVLKPDRALLVFCSDIKMFTIKTLMDSIKGLTFIKPFYYVVEAKPSCLRGYGIYTWTTPALLYVKGDGWPKRTGRRCPDTKIEQITTFVSREKPKGKHKWNKNPKVLESWVRAFTDPGETVFDPFTGSAPIPYVCTQLERKFVAFEIDPPTMDQARDRLSVVQKFFEIKPGQKSFIE